LCQGETKMLLILGQSHLVQMLWSEYTDTHPGLEEEAQAIDKFKD